MKPWLLIFGVAIMLVIAGCSSDDDSDGPTAPGSTEDAPQFNVPRVQVPQPMQQSTDMRAQTVVFYTNLANSFGASLGGNFMPPSPDVNMTLRDARWEYNWKEDELEVKVVIRDENDKYTWEVFYSGKADEFTYSNFRAFRAEQGKDERSGKFFMFVPNTTIVLGQYTWQLDENNAILFEVKVTSDLTSGNRFVGQSNADKSGTLQVYASSGGESALIEEYEWAADGSGNWAVYDGGELVDSGTWN